MSRSLRSIAADRRVLDALDKPRTTNEIVAHLRREVWDTWAAEHGIELFYRDGMPADPIERGLAFMTAEKRGLVPLNQQQVYARLRKFEREGSVQRIQLPGHRAILWRRA